MACAWIMTGYLQGITEYTWLDNLAETYYCSATGDDDTIPECPRPARDFLTPDQSYAAGLYWSFVTITSVGALAPPAPVKFA